MSTKFLGLPPDPPPICVSPVGKMAVAAGSNATSIPVKTNGPAHWTSQKGTDPPATPVCLIVAAGSSEHITKTAHTDPRHLNVELCLRLVDGRERCGELGNTLMSCGQLKKPHTLAHNAEIVSLRIRLIVGRQWYFARGYVMLMQF